MDALAVIQGRHLGWLVMDDKTMADWFEKPWLLWFTHPWLVIDHGVDGPCVNPEPLGTHAFTACAAAASCMHDPRLRRYGVVASARGGMHCSCVFHFKDAVATSPWSGKAAHVCWCAYSSCTCNKWTDRGFDYSFDCRSHHV